MAQLSTTISQAQRATAFHFLTSNLFLLEPEDVDETAGESTSILSDSAIFAEIGYFP